MLTLMSFKPYTTREENSVTEGYGRALRPSEIRRFSGRTGAREATRAGAAAAARLEASAQ